MSSLVRTPVVLPFAAAATVGIFLIMKGLIAVDIERPIEEKEPIDIVLIDQPDEVDPNRIDRFESLPEIEPPPPPERVLVDTAEPDTVTQHTVFTAADLSTPTIEITHTGPVHTSRTPSPIVRVQPNYPPRLEERGIEGQCTVVFDILPTGVTANVRILSCSNTGFEAVSRRAVANWRYQPQLRDGEPTTFRGATTQLVYRLDA